VGALDDALGRRVGADTRHPSQPMAYVAQRLLVRVEPELALGVEVAAVPQAGNRREVVRGDGAQRPPRERLRQSGFEPETAVREDASLRQRLPHAVFDGAQVLADDEGAGPRAFERHDAEQVVGGIADVPTLGRGETGRNPEEPEQPHDVVDAKAASVAERGPDRFDEGPVAGAAQAMRDEWWQEPVLSCSHVAIRRRANRRAQRERVLPGPGVRAFAIDADRQVLHQRARRGGAGELSVELPLEPHVKVHALALSASELGDGR
jgi:hypothetical protein